MNDWTIVGLQIFIQVLLLAYYNHRLENYDWKDPKSEPSIGLFLFSIFAVFAVSMTLQIVN